MTDADVLIVGAGLSGVGAACHLAREMPGTTYVILEARDAIGGTWDLFRYPGIRSDSDMHTLGYSFRPWQQPKAIADGPSIRRYVVETAHEHGVVPQIRFGHRVVAAEWSSDEARWTVRATHAGGDVDYTCRFLFVCSGYYRYDEGYTPEIAGRADYQGAIVHPQHWPDDLDVVDKRVVVVGSGATAVTLVPALAGRAAHVTMLQRTPTYILSIPTHDPLAGAMRRWLPPAVASRAVTWKNVLLSLGTYQLSRRRPDLLKRLLRRGVLRQLPAGYPVDTHFAPPYEPWDQRLCLVPDGDLFQAVATGRAEVVTDRIERFTETGLLLASGRHLDADLVVTATGLTLLLLGGITLTVDGREIDLADTVAYKAMMLSGVPNLAMAIGYTNASWTLKVDLVSEYVCRLLAYMREHGYDMCTPQRPPDGERRPLLDLTSGYVQRSASLLPKQGARPPWRVHQNYVRDLWMFRHGRLDEAMQFSVSRRQPAGRSTPVA